MGRLEGRVAIVTGGSSGIGRAIARRFAAEGARVSVADITEAAKERGPPTVELIRSAGGEAVYARTDVALWADVDRLVTGTVDRWGRLDVMVNNAAVYTSRPLLDEDKAGWNHVLSVNLTGYFFGCKRAVQQMLTQPEHEGVRGRLINVTSQHGMVAAPSDVAYGVSKAGGVYLTRQIAADYGRHGIVCNAVAPGKIVTGKPGAAMDPAALAYSRARTPLPRLGEPDDVAAAALFLASDEARFMTGVNLMVDGGWMAA